MLQWLFLGVLMYNIMVAKGQHVFRNLIGSLLIGYQVISPSLTILGIQIVNIENKFYLESTVSAYPRAFHCFCSVSLQINLTTFYSVCHFNHLNGIVNYPLLLIIFFFMHDVCKFAALIMPQYFKSQISTVQNNKRFLRTRNTRSQS